MDETAGDNETLANLSNTGIWCYLVYSTFKLITVIIHVVIQTADNEEILVVKT